MSARDMPVLLVLRPLEGLTRLDLIIVHLLGRAEPSRGVGSSHVPVSHGVGHSIGFGARNSRTMPRCGPWSLAGPRIT